MPAFSYDIADIFKEQFGFRPPANYKIPNKQKGTVTGGSEDFGYDIPTKISEPEYGRYGSPYQFKQQYAGGLRDHYMPIKLGGVQLWYPVVSVELPKTIISTSLTERRGSVHEIINTDDIVINVKGLIVGENNTFPEAELSQLNDLFNIDNSVLIQSVITDIFFQGEKDIKVLIKKVDISPKTGVKHVVPYEMNLVSDLIFELDVA